MASDLLLLLFMLFLIFISLCVTWLLLFFLVPRLNLLDRPNSRSSHVLPTPRGGGIAFVLVSCVACIAAYLLGQDWFPILLPLFALPLAFVGYLDDKYNLPSYSRYFFHLLTGLLLLWVSPLVQGLGVFDGSINVFSLLIFFLLLISSTAVINFVNFTDGLDGLVAGCMVVSIATVILSISSAFSLWALVGSLLGFLFWNWSPAKVFMGDVGSTFLGAVFAGLVLQASSWLMAFGFLLLATPLLGDAFVCVLRRFLAGEDVFEAHRLHLFQRLHQAGWPHSRVSLAYISATAFLSLAMLAGGWPWVFSLAVFELLIGVWLDQRVAVPFAVASKS